MVNLGQFWQLLEQRIGVAPARENRKGLLVFLVFGLGFRFPFGPVYDS
jgi:hypothetical protein